MVELQCETSCASASKKVSATELSVVAFTRHVSLLPPAR